MRIAHKYLGTAAAKSDFGLNAEALDSFHAGIEGAEGWQGWDFITPYTMGGPPANTYGWCLYYATSTIRAQESPVDRVRVAIMLFGRSGARIAQLIEQHPRFFNVLIDLQGESGREENGQV